MSDQEYATSAIQNNVDCCEESSHNEGTSQDATACKPQKKLRKHREKISWVWQYFIQEGNQAVCQFCENSFMFSSTTTLSYHLNHVHKNLVTDGSSPKLKNQNPTNSGITSNLPSPKKMENLSQKSLPHNFLKETTMLISNVLGKSPNLRVVKVVTDPTIVGHNENHRRKHPIEGNPLDEPARKKTRIPRGKSSWVWQYFLKEGNMASCKFCQASLSSASTTTLSYHLNNLHKDSLTDHTTKSDSSQLKPELKISNFSSLTRLKITTNVSKSTIPSNFLKEISSLTSEILNKPENVCKALQDCVVSIVPDRMMLWGGQEGPCAFVRLTSKGKLSLDQSKNYSKILGEHIEKNLGVNPGHLCFEYRDITSFDHISSDKTVFSDSDS